MTPHLHISTLPLAHSGDLETVCGLVIAGAQPQAIWDEVLMGRPLDLEGTRVCRRCRSIYNLLLESDAPQRYVYAIVPGGSDETSAV